MTVRDERRVQQRVDSALSRRRYVRTHFQQDIDNPCLYDLVINTARFSPEATALFIVAALEDRLLG